MTIITISFFLQTSNAENHLLYLFYFCLAGRFQQNQDRRSQPARHKDAGQWLNPREKCFVSLSPPRCTCNSAHVLFTRRFAHMHLSAPLRSILEVSSVSVFTDSLVLCIFLSKG